MGLDYQFYTRVRERTLASNLFAKYSDRAEFALVTRAIAFSESKQRSIRMPLPHIRR